MAQSNPSTPSNKQSVKGTLEPSPQEARFFFSIIKNMQNKPDIDWATVAEENGLKNAKVAAVSLDLPYDALWEGRTIILDHLCSILSDSCASFHRPDMAR